MRGKRWFKLDNAAKLYPAVSSFRWSSAFRISVELTETVDSKRLQQAVDNILPRFPSLKVRMRSGIFWYYLEEIQEPLTVRQDAGHPCMPFRFRQDHGYLLRVFYYRSRISAEFFHSLTDGTGGLAFIKTLAVEYLRLGGKRVLFDHGASRPLDKPGAEETQDAFLHMPLPHVRSSRREEPAYHFPATPEIPHTLHIIAASIPCVPLLAQAKALNASLTEYLVSVMLWIAYQNQESQHPRRKRPLRVSVPVNMRAFYPIPTMRNFSTFVNPGVDPRLGAYTFEEIVSEVHAYMKYAVNPKLLSAVIATNVADEKNLLVRLVPRFIKNWVISSIFRKAGDRLVTATLSNLGRVELPTGTDRLIRRFEFQLGPPSAPLCNCASVTTGSELRLIFSSNIRETTLPREMLRFLVERGIPVTVESNMEDE
ncbi:MAG: alcohol acetyltransferase [Clostridia bacterium]|nr:alcohol acetyltransferase [Clostridia bacterium]MBR4539582.1 alcohol acetyltransferase [Clostridia bacterium]